MIPPRLAPGRKPRNESPLRDHRRALGWSQTKAAAWAASKGLLCSARTWRAWEAGTNAPPPILARLFFAVKVKPTFSK